jgi:branched-chain amino acid transport system ATP-binding protein
VSLLEIQDLTKRFGHLTAVRNLNLTIPAGERHAIIGSNGAGKTSLFDMISGRLRPTLGSVRFRNMEITTLPPHSIARMGLARSFQIANIFPHLSVRENLRLGVQARRRRRHIWETGRSILVETAERAAELLDRVHLSHVADLTSATLSYGDQRRLEIGLALSLDPMLILLDEPTAGTSLAASHEIVDLLRQIPRAVTLVLIEHDIDVVLRLSDRVTVMHRGEILAQGKPKEVECNPRVQQAYFGDAMESLTGAAS